MTKKFLNKKKQIVYELIDFCINATNEQDGQRMILYKRIEEDMPQLYVRSETEFFEKFEEIKDFLP